MIAMSSIPIIPSDTAFSNPFQPKEPSNKPIAPDNNVPPINTMITFTPTSANTNTST